ncbi:MAG: cadherin domain-containing protein [Ekhidna sp.]|nr:cadherin domain-containing protein [Ekhidna sp.]
MKNFILYLMFGVLFACPTLGQIKLAGMGTWRGGSVFAINSDGSMREQTNRAPVFAAGGTAMATVDEGATSSDDAFITVSATDPDTEQVLTYSLTGMNSEDFQIDSDGNIKVENGVTLDFETTRSYSITVVATDNGSSPLTAERSLSITVNDVNEAPVFDAVDTTPTVAADAVRNTMVVTVRAVDEDAGDGVPTYAISAGNPGSPAANGFKISAAGVISVENNDLLTPGTITLTVTATDGRSKVGMIMFDVMITEASTPANNKPSFTSGGTSGLDIDEDATGDVRRFTANANDAEQAVIYSLRGTNSDDFSIDAMSGQITVGDGGLDFETTQSYSLTVVATDDGTPPLEDTRTFSITVNDVNDSNPVINSVAIASAEENQTNTGLTVTATDADGTGEVITFRFVSGGTTDNGKFSLSTGGVLTFLSAPDFENPTDVGGDAADDNKYVVKVEAYDGVNTSDPQDITITVTDVNEIADRAETAGFSDITFDLTSVFTDADNDALTYTATSNAADVVTVAVNNNNLVITYAGEGTSTITVTANDSNGGTVEDVFTVTVNAASVTPTTNTPPTVANEIADRMEIENFSTITINLEEAGSEVFADADSDELTYTATSSATDVVTVTVSDSDLTITYVGTGTSTITVTADDGKRGSAADAFDVKVTSKPLGFAEEIDLEIFPNPATGFVQVRSSGEVHATLTDLNGRMIHTGSGDEIMLDMHSLPNGIYLLTVSKGVEGVRRKIVKSD